MSDDNPTEHPELLHKIVTGSIPHKELKSNIENLPHQLGTRERKRIIADLSCWKMELERNNADFANAELHEYLENVADYDDTTLIDEWFGSVGEWLGSNDRIHVPPTVSFEDYINYQFGLLIDGIETDYGWILTSYTPSDIDYSEPAGET